MPVAPAVIVTKAVARVDGQIVLSMVTRVVVDGLVEIVVCATDALVVFEEIVILSVFTAAVVGGVVLDAAVVVIANEVVS